MHSLTYLYGVVPAGAPDAPDELTGIDDAPVRVVRGERVAAVVSEVGAAEYADDLLDERLSDLSWVGARGLAHEGVLDWFAERGPVIPLSLFSLHRDEARVSERLAGESERFERVLERLRGKREWGVKLWRDDERLAGSLAQLSPAVAALAAEIEQAPPGRRVLLEKKRDAVRADEMRRVSSRVTHEVYARLRDAAAESTTVSIPANATPTARVLVLHAAFLVADSDFDAFQRRLSELAATFQPTGFEFEFTGPWPPYHFASSDAA